MAEGYEVAKAVVTLIPSMQGSQAAITKELTGASAVAGKSAGETMGKGMSGGLSSSMASVGKTIAGVTAGVVGGVAAVGAVLMDSFKEVDAGLDTIRTKTGASGQELEGMRTNMENLATSIPTSFEEAGAAIGEVNTRFGLTGTALEDLSGQFIKFAKLNDTDVSTSVDNVSKVINAFGMDASETGNILDALNKVGQNTGVDMNTLTTTLSQNAAQLQEMGLSAYDAAGFLGECDVAGLEISTTMMGLKTAMKNATAEGKPLDEFLGEFTQTMNSNASESDKLSAAYETFGTRAGGAIYNAVKNGKINLEDLTNSLGDFEGSVDSTFEAVTDPTDEFGEVLNRLKIVGADLAEKAMPLVQTALEGVAGAIEFVVDALTPAETSLTRFIDATGEAIDKNRDAISASEQAVNDTLASVGEMEIYKDTLMDLLNQSEKTEIEQFMLKDAVEQLSASVPGLKEAYDEVNGTFSISNDEILEMIENAEALALKNAMMEAQKETMEEYAKALVDSKMAYQGVKQAAEEFNNTSEYTYSGLEGLLAVGGDASKMLSDQSRHLTEANDKYSQASENLERARKNMEILPDALEDLQKELGQDTPAAAEAAANGLNEVGDAATDSAAEVSTASATTEAEMAAMEEAAQKLEEEYIKLQDTVQQTVSNSISIFDEFSGGTELTVDKMIENLQGANAGVEQWIEDMKLLGEKAGKDFPQALYDELLTQGPEKTASAVRALAEAAQNESPQFETVANEYANKLNLANKAENLAAFSSAGKDVASKTAQGVKDGTGQVEQASKAMANQSMTAANAEIDQGTTNMRNTALMGMNSVNNTVLGQLNIMNDNFSTYMGMIEGNVGGMINSVRSALAQPIYGPNIKVPHFTMSGSFNAQTNSVPTVSVAWYAKGAIFQSPTIFDTPSGLKGVGEDGAEAVLPIELLKNYIEDAIEASPAPIVNVEMTVNGAESPEAWAADFARNVKQMMRIG